MKYRLHGMAGHGRTQVCVSAELRIEERQAQKFGENCMQACRSNSYGPLAG